MAAFVPRFRSLLFERATELMDRLRQAALVALRSSNRDNFDELVRELRGSNSEALQTVGTTIELRRAAAFGQGHVAQVLLSRVGDLPLDDPCSEMVTWAHHNIRGMICDDTFDVENALRWHEKAAVSATLSGLDHEERLARQIVVRTATRYGRSDVIKSATAHLGRLGPGSSEMLCEVFECLGDWETAHWHYDDSELAETDAIPTIGRARADIAAGNLDRAAASLAELSPLAEDNIRTRSSVCVLTARALLRSDAEQSRSLAEEAISFGESYGFAADAPDARLTLAEYEVGAGRLSSALEMLEDVDSKHMLIRDRARCFDIQSRAMWAHGLKKEALTAHAGLRKTMEEVDVMRSLLWDTYRDLIRDRRLQAEEAKLAPVNEELRVAGETMHVAAAQTGHDLRSGLGVIKLAMSLPLEESMWRIARSALDQMNDIIEQVQRVNSLDDSARLNPRFGSDDSEVFDFAEVVEQAIEQHQLQVDRKQQNLELWIGEGTFPISGHRVLAVQIANNLIENAMHYTPEGGSIRVDLTKEGGKAVLDVTDSGLGVAAGDEDRIFRAFVQVHRPTSGESSSGLGLYIVRSSAQRFGGEVTLRARGDEPGSTFRVVLPIRR